MLESRRGTTEAQNDSWFEIDRDVTSDHEGSVWLGALGRSGSWQISVEQDTLQQVRITGDPNAFDFGYLLRSPILRGSVSLPAIFWHGAAPN